ncbi:Protein of unknown function [Gryllus bimaculatus]|nr:Protein of unknown function [Gryllus bimaculatus]
MRLAVITMCVRFVCVASGTLMDPYEAAVGAQETRHPQQLPTSPPDLFPPLPTKIGLVGADASSLSFAFYEPCTPESCLPICWYIKNLMVHMDIEEGLVLSWLPPKSKCTTLLEYRVIKLSNYESTESSGGKFWSNVTDMVTWPTKPCVAYPERHCHLLGSTSAHIFHVQVKRTQDGALSKPEKCRRISTLGPPVRPRGLEVAGVQTQALELRWRLPLLPGGLPAHALVRVSAGAAVRNHTVCVRGQALMAFKVTALRPGTLFNVSVSFLQNGIAGEPATVQGRTAPEGRRAPSSKPITSSTIDELPGTNALLYESSSQNAFDSPRPTEQLHYRSNVTRSRGMPGEERDGARALTDPTPLSTSPPTVRPKTTLNVTDANNQTNNQKLTEKANTTAEHKASCVTDRNRLHKRSESFNSSWTFIAILCLQLEVSSLDIVGDGKLRTPEISHQGEAFIGDVFDPHEYEDVTQPPPYEVLKTENNLDQWGMQPLNPTELLQSQVASDQGPSNSTASRMAKERTF